MCVILYLDQQLFPRIAAMHRSAFPAGEGALAVNRIQAMCCQSLARLYIWYFMYTMDAECVHISASVFLEAMLSDMVSLSHGMGVPRR